MWSLQLRRDLWDQSSFKTATNFFWEVQMWYEVILKLSLFSGMYKGWIAFVLPKKLRVPAVSGAAAAAQEDGECWPSESAALC